MNSTKLFILAILLLAGVAFVSQVDAQYAYYYPNYYSGYSYYPYSYGYYYPYNYYSYYGKREVNWNEAPGHQQQQQQIPSPHGQH
ncbi:unnamed protein product, partial [Mesorhabditis belari]|uniref:Uncharacterized protein n=1 Tax=Mesorhabditis belari TaxID=2138241 RepID=A0AAF3F8L4_9BILA